MRNALTAIAYLALGGCAMFAATPDPADWDYGLPPEAVSIEVGPVQPGANCLKPETLDAFTKTWCDRTGPALVWENLP